MAFYRQSNGAGKSGPGISGDGYDGAESFFEQAKTVAGELKLPFIPTDAEESAAAKAAVDAYMGARNGNMSPTEAFFHNGEVPNEFPQVELSGEADGGITDSNPLQNIGKAFAELMNNMGDMFAHMLESPLGFLGSLLGFLVKLFTEIAGAISETMQEVARAAASVAEDAWKKQMEAIASSNPQSIEVFSKQATTQTLSHSLKNSST